MLPFPVQFSYNFVLCSCFNTTEAHRLRILPHAPLRLSTSLSLSVSLWCVQPSQASPAAVRLGVLSGIGFTISTLGLSRKVGQSLANSKDCFCID